MTTNPLFALLLSNPAATGAAGALAMAALMAALSMLIRSDAHIAQAAQVLADADSFVAPLVAEAEKLNLPGAVKFGYVASKVATYLASQGIEGNPDRFKTFIAYEIEVAVAKLAKSQAK